MRKCANYIYVSPFIGIKGINSLYDKRNVQIEEPRVKNGGRLLGLIAPILQIPGKIIGFPFKVIGSIIKN